MGWALASFRPVPLQASAGDRSGESIVATGPVLVRYDEAAKGPVALDAVYFLDYKGGRLLATVPSFRQTTTATRLIEPFSERDLVADFKLDLDYRSASALPDDHRLDRPRQCRLGSPLRLRDQHQPGGGVSNADANDDRHRGSTALRAPRGAFFRQRPAKPVRRP